MTDTAETRRQQRSELLRALEENRKRRQKAEGALMDARDDLTELLVRGKSLAWPLYVAEMSRAAEVSRETAHKLLREARTDG